MTEHDEQAAVIAWARMMGGRWPCLDWLHAIPNGAQFGADKRLAVIQYNKLKAEGFTPGIPDLFLPFPSRNYHGFYIEMKRSGNEKGVRERQLAFMEYAEGVGYLCQVHDNAEAAIEALEWYLSGEIWLASP